MFQLGRATHLSIIIPAGPTSYLAAGIGSKWLQLFRTTAGAIYKSTSADGLRWTPAKPSLLPNPNSKVLIWALQQGLCPYKQEHPAI